MNQSYGREDLRFDVRALQVIRVGSLLVSLWGVGAARCESGQPVELRGHADAVYDVAFSPDGRVMASGSYDKTVVLWDLSARRKLATLRGHKDQVFRVRFSPDGKYLASCSGDSTVIIWNVRTQESEMVLAGHGDPIIDAAYSADGSLVATAGSHVQLWKRGHQVWSTPHSQLFFSIVFSPDQETLACGTRDLVRIYDVSDAASRGDIVAGNGMVYQLEYSPDGKWLASACSDGRLSIWDAVSREKKRAVTADNSALFASAFSLDGKHLVSGGRERVIRIWTVPTLQLVSERYGPSETVLSVRFSQDGKQIAAGAYDGRIHLWSLDN